MLKYSNRTYTCTQNTQSFSILDKVPVKWGPRVYCIIVTSFTTQNIHHRIAIPLLHIKLWYTLGVYFLYTILLQLNFSSLWLGIQSTYWCRILAKLHVPSSGNWILLQQIDIWFYSLFTVCWRHWCKGDPLKVEYIPQKGTDVGICVARLGHNFFECRF